MRLYFQSEVKFYSCKLVEDGYSLIFYGYKHRRIHHQVNEFARGKNHVNGIESFWSYVKRRLRKFNGAPKIKEHLRRQMT